MTRRSHDFTILDLRIVVAIIANIVTMAIPGFRHARKTAKVGAAIDRLDYGGIAFAARALPEALISNRGQR